MVVMAIAIAMALIAAACGAAIALKLVPTNLDPNIGWLMCVVGLGFAARIGFHWRSIT